MRVLAAIAGAALLLGTLLDVFENIILPKRMQSRFQLTPVFYRWSWKPWAALGRRIAQGRRRERFLSFYGPLSLLILFAAWALVIVLAFGLLQWAAGLHPTPARHSIANDFFFSSTSFFNLLSAPARSPATRSLMMLESAIGFGFLGLLISYLPVLYRSFSRREVGISMLDARAGSPATAAALLLRHGRNLPKLDRLLEHWEEWSAEVLETHLSYPVLAYFRSHHNNQSWLASLTAVLDASALLSLADDNETLEQAQLTFAMARHAVVDLTTVLNALPRAPSQDRLPDPARDQLLAWLQQGRVPLRFPFSRLEKLRELRAMYEPYAHALEEHFLTALPPWIPEKMVDNWRSTDWGRESTPAASSDPFHSGSGEAA
ncbi:MAG TPA: hypothetical protein VLC12_04320 [Terriglobales bacterium]|nr:hypothetical protein [Terriglobales bacterium]